MTAAALAPITKSIELIMASRSAYRHPAVAAQMSANLDHISAGRFTVNIVSGWWGHECEMASVPFPPHGERYDLSAKVMEILRGYWAEDSFDFSGKYFEIKGGVTTPKPSRRPTFYFGGESKAALCLAGRAADVFLFNGRPLDEAKALMDDVNREADAATFAGALLLAPAAARIARNLIDDALEKGKQWVRK